MTSVKNTAKYILVVFIMLVLYVIIQVPPLSEVLWDNETTANVAIIKHTLLFLIASIVSLALTLKFYQSTNGTAIWRIPISLRGLLIACVSAIGSQFIQYLLTVTSRSDGSDASIVQAMHSPLAFITIATVVIISPILEELLFQGVLQGYLLASFRPWISIVITSIIFTFAHGYGFSIGTLALFFSGLAYALVYHATKDIKIAILTHALSNLIVIFLDLFVFA